jgi:hypothetical protein
MRRILALFALLHSTVAFASDQSASGKTTSRPPWEWTLEERIRDRSDPVKAAQRVAAAQIATSSSNDTINGRRNPELFLPIELFQIFVSGAFTEDPTGRAVYRQGCVEASTVALPADFWARLETITGTYVFTLNRARALNREAGAAQGNDRKRLQHQSATIQAKQCETLADNLESARQAFGQPFFDRFLYESVAPDSGIGLERPNTPSELMRIANGCR